MQVVQTVAPTAEPVTLEEAKEFMRILDTDSDTLISSLIAVCREHVENITNRQLGVATFELTVSDFISKLPKNPIKSIEKIEYMGVDGNYLTLDSSTYYMYERHGIGYISYSEVPNILEHQKAVKITFIAGYELVPEAIKQYIKVKASTLYENRESYVVGVSIAEFGNEFVENLLSSYKIRSI